jgi:hypothetical protein
VANQLGAIYGCAQCGASYIVFGPGDGELTCCEPMARLSGLERRDQASSSNEAVGQRFRCATCATAVLCTARGKTEVRCCGQQMARYAAPSLPPVG